jgi:isopentenyl diphosphate isomerase/L-lactate dehydrogenase-like FMN-dependent dehydrogenase
VLDHVPGTAEVLHSVASAVQGRLTVLADGGVRDGADVLKMLALGADAVLIGRPVAIAAMGGLRQGVAGYLGAVRAQLAQAMVLTGCADLGSVSRRVLYAPA